MKTASGAARRHQLGRHLVPARARAGALASASCAHRHPDVGVDGVRARHGLARIVDDGDVAVVARDEVEHLAPLGGLGLVAPAARRRSTSTPAGAPASISERATLSLSPMYASRSPSSWPNTSRSVRKSASAWQGWWSSVRALMTGTSECCGELGDRRLGERADDDARRRTPPACARCRRPSRRGRAGARRAAARAAACPDDARRPRTRRGYGSRASRRSSAERLRAKRVEPAVRASASSPRPGRARPRTAPRRDRRRGRKSGESLVAVCGRT